MHSAAAHEHCNVETLGDTCDKGTDGGQRAAGLRGGTAYGYPAQAVAHLDTSRGRGQSEINALRDTTVRHPDRLVVSAHLDLRGNRLGPREVVAGLRQPGWTEPEC